MEDGKANPLLAPAGALNLGIKLKATEDVAILQNSIIEELNKVNTEATEDESSCPAKKPQMS